MAVKVYCKVVSSSRGRIRPASGGRLFRSWRSKHPEAKEVAKTFQILFSFKIKSEVSAGVRKSSEEVRASQRTSLVSAPVACPRLVWALLQAAASGADGGRVSAGAAGKQGMKCTPRLALL